MTNFRLEVRATPGSNIRDVAAEACVLATRFGIWINFKFNDVDCNAAPNSDPESLAIAQQIAQGTTREYKVAHAYADGSSRPSFESLSTTDRESAESMRSSASAGSLTEAGKEIESLRARLREALELLKHFEFIAHGPGCVCAMCEKRTTFFALTGGVKNG